MEKNLCVDNCQVIKEYKFEYNNICYKDYNSITLETNNTTEVNGTTSEINNFTEFNDTTSETNNSTEVNDTTSETNDKNDKNSYKKKIIGLIIGIIIAAILIIILSILIIKIYLTKKKRENEEKNKRGYEKSKCMSIIIMSSDQKILFPVTCKPTDNINFIEKKLYEEYPELKGTKHYFLCNGIALYKHKSLKNLGIKNGDRIILNQILESEQISLSNREIS